MNYILCKDVNGTWEPRGVYGSEAEARTTALTGDLLLIPIDPNQSFDTTIINEGATGAILFSLVSTDTTVQDISDRLTIAENRQGAIITAAQDLVDRVETAEGLLESAETYIIDLRQRVSDLEGA